jgi:hypothetical protein
MSNSKAELSRRSVLAGVGVALAGGVVATQHASAGTNADTLSTPDLSAYGLLTDLATNAAILPTHQGARGDYTGRPGTAGTGTDNRAMIQAALNAASNRNDPTYYGYLSIKNGTVKLPSGDYYISAPVGGGASLVVPPRVTFDTSDATLYFDFPMSATATWCGIQVGQYAQLIVGRLYSKAGSTAPDSALVYDAVRLWQTDNNTRVIGYKDSEISGFQGAGIRGVGAWISNIRGIRFTGLKYGYIASNYGDGTLGGMLSNPSGGGTSRTHTDLRFTDCQFVNISNGGLVGVVQGNAGNINNPNTTLSGLTIGMVGCIFESIGAFAMNINYAYTVSLFDCAFEEVGSTVAMISLNTVRNFTAIGTRVNLAGRNIPGPSGNTTAQPAAMFNLASVQSFTIEGLYMHNTYYAPMALASAAASGWRIGGVFTDSDDFATGPMYTGKSQSLSGAWNGGHAVIGGQHIWADSGGRLRVKATAPSSTTDGGYVNAETAVRHRSRSGAYTLPTGGTASVVTLANGQCRYGPIDIPEAVVFSRIGLEITGAGDAGARVLLGVYAEDNAGFPIGSPLVTATIVANAIGWQESAVAWTPPVPGRYIVAAAAIRAPTRAPLIRSQTGYAPGVVCLATPPGSLTGYADIAIITSTLPTTPTITSNVGGPMVGLKAA